MNSSRHSSADCQTILKRFSLLSDAELAELFKNGTAFNYPAIAGETAGRFVGWQPGNPPWLPGLVKLFFQTPLGHWTGKAFRAPFEGANRGWGVNLFANRLRPWRYRFDTYLKTAYSDGRPCVALDYRPYFSLMLGLVDDLRQVEPGIFLGQMWYRFPWKRKPKLIGYFVLCNVI